MSLSSTHKWPPNHHQSAKISAGEARPMMENLSDNHLIFSDCIIAHSTVLWTKLSTLKKYFYSFKSISLCFEENWIHFWVVEIIEKLLHPGDRVDIHWQHSNTHYITCLRYTGTRTNVHKSAQLHFSSLLLPPPTTSRKIPNHSRLTKFILSGWQTLLALRQTNLG